MRFERMWRTLSEAMLIEYQQSVEEGKDVAKYEYEARKLYQAFLNDYVMEPEARALMDKMKDAPLRQGYKYVEYSDLEGIRKTRSKERNEIVPVEKDEALLDKIYGAWLGRCAGCLFGQPVEGWERDRITGLMKATGNYSPTYYISSDIPQEVRDKYGVTDEGHVYGSDHINWINNVSYMPEDDDTNYTCMNLKALETHGKDLKPSDMADIWLMNMPYLHACTAERVAYKNLVDCIEPPASADYYNPYREWIGAQIRADVFGYVYPGNPEAAAELAFQDACISHVKNGIYGEMYFAAAIAEAAVNDDTRSVLIAALREIPETSRLHESLSEVIGWYDDGKMSAEEAIGKIRERYDELFKHDWCHTISNAMICAVSLLWGEKDFGKTLGIAVTAGFDTDCNGATCGSLLGMLLGAKALPASWIDPLQDSLKSGIDGFGFVKISDLAKRTFALV